LLAPVLIAAVIRPATAQTISISGPGVSGDTLTLGFEAPITGTGVNYGTSFEEAANAYWKWAASQGRKIANKTVKIIAQDDQLRPDTATLVCTRLAEQAFLIVGWQGSVNAKACAAAANRAGTPYVARGNDESIGEFPVYFATSPTYSSDGQILARFIKDTMGGAGTKVMFGAFNTPANEILTKSFEKTAESLGLGVSPSVRIGYTAASAEQVSGALAIRDSGAQVTPLIWSPAVLATAFSTWNAQNYHPKLLLYVNDQQAEFLCNTLTPEQTAALYAPNPWPNVDLVEKVQPGFKQAFQQLTGREPNSNDVSIWTTMAFVDAMFQKAGPDITRAAFLERVGNATIETPFLGPVTYRPGNHIDAGSEFMLKLSCADKALLTYSKVSR
jgi:ABC-type branched-subunit amino acid transport system substrate-binding protein